MARKVTSKRVAKIASKVLRNKRQDKKSKIAAARGGKRNVTINSNKHDGRARNIK